MIFHREQNRNPWQVQIQVVESSCRIENGLGKNSNCPMWRKWANVLSAIRKACQPAMDFNKSLENAVFQQTSLTPSGNGWWTNGASLHLREKNIDPQHQANAAFPCQGYLVRRTLAVKIHSCEVCFFGSKSVDWLFCVVLTERSGLEDFGSAEMLGFFLLFVWVRHCVQ